MIRKEMEFPIDPHIEEDPPGIGPTISGPEFDFSVDRFYNAAIPRLRDEWVNKHIAFPLLPEKPSDQLAAGLFYPPKSECQEK